MVQLGCLGHPSLIRISKEVMVAWIKCASSSISKCEKVNVGRGNSVVLIQVLGGCWWLVQYLTMGQHQSWDWMEGPSIHLPLSGRDGVATIPESSGTEARARSSLSGWFIWGNFLNLTSLPLDLLLSRCQMVNYRLYFSFFIYSEILWPSFISIGKKCF